LITHEKSAVLLTILTNKWILLPILILIIWEYFMNNFYQKKVYFISPNIMADSLS